MLHIRSKVIIFARIFVAVFLVVMVVGCSEPPTTTGPVTKILSVGDKRILDSGGEITPVAISREALEGWFAARTTKDDYGQKELIISGKILPAKRGTELLVIEKEVLFLRVRILSGDLAPNAVWIARSWAKDPVSKEEQNKKEGR
jgi:hypothetical protein